jgi:hypothetical protein
LIAVIRDPILAAPNNNSISSPARNRIQSAHGNPNLQEIEMKKLAALLSIALCAGHASAQNVDPHPIAYSAPAAPVIQLLDRGASTVTVQATGGATLSANFRVSDDYANWQPIAGYAVPGGTVPVTSATGDGYWSFNVSGHKYFQYNLTSITGTETVTLVGAPGSSPYASATLSPTIGRTSSVLTRPANTTAYSGTASAPVLIGSSTTSGAVVVPSFAIGISGGSAVAPLGTLTTNATTGWGGVALVVTLWNGAPTFTNGDGGAYAVATGAANFAAQYNCTLIQYGDGAACNLVPLAGSAPTLQPASGTTEYWDIQVQSSATPISGQTFTLHLPPWN